MDIGFIVIKWCPNSASCHPILPHIGRPEMFLYRIVFATRTVVNCESPQLLKRGAVLHFRKHLKIPGLHIGMHANKDMQPFLKCLLSSIKTWISNQIKLGNKNNMLIKVVDQGTCMVYAVMHTSQPKRKVLPCMHMTLYDKCGIQTWWSKLN